MRTVGLLAAALALAAVCFGAYVRLAGDDPAVWAVDASKAQPTRRPNSWRVGPTSSDGPEFDAEAPVYDVDAAELAAAFDAVALAEPRTARIAGAPGELSATYVQRSRIMAYPDYISVRFIDLPGGRSTLAVFSRARFGYGDMGVNRARVERWLTALATPLAAQD